MMKKVVHISGIAVILFFTLRCHDLYAETDPSPAGTSRVEELMTRLRGMVVEYQAKGAPQEDLWPRILNLVDKDIPQCGDDAVEIVMRHLPKTDDQMLFGLLVRILGETRGEQAARGLVKVLCEYKGINSGTALEELVRRTERDNTLGVPLSENDIQTIAEYMDRNVTDEYVAGRVARFLGKCSETPVSARIDPILGRFLYQVRNPTSATSVFGSYVSPQVYMLNKYLLAFEHIGAAAIPYLKRAYEQTSPDDDKEVRKWLCIARGIAGDSGVSASLEDIVLHDSDTSVRLEAVRAYGACAGEAAIPVLKGLLADESETGFGDHFEGIASPVIALEARVQLRDIYKKLGRPCDPIRDFPIGAPNGEGSSGTIER